MTRNDILQEAMRHRRALTCYAYGMLKDWSLAEDAVQEATIAASDKWHTFRGEAAILSWLRSITRRKAVDIMRKRRREIDYQPDALDHLVERAFDKRLTAAETDRLESRRQALSSCMQNLRQDAFEMLIGFYRDRISCDELALRYNRSTNAVWLVLSRSRKQLRACIQKQLVSS